MWRAKCPEVVNERLQWHVYFLACFVGAPAAAAAVAVPAGVDPLDVDEEEEGGVVLRAEPRPVDAVDDKGVGVEGVVGVTGLCK